MNSQDHVTRLTSPIVNKYSMRIMCMAIQSPLPQEIIPVFMVGVEAQSQEFNKQIPLG